MKRHKNRTLFDFVQIRTKTQPLCDEDALQTSWAFSAVIHSRLNIEVLS